MLFYHLHTLNAFSDIEKCYECKSKSGSEIFIVIYCFLRFLWPDRNAIFIFPAFFLLAITNMLNGNLSGLSDKIRGILIAMQF